jgi:hypothetical protein
MCELASAVQRRHVGYLPAFGFLRLRRGVLGTFLSEAYQSQFVIRSIPISVCYQKHTNLSLLSEAYQSQMQVASVKQSNVCHGRGEAYYFGART